MAQMEEELRDLVPKAKEANTLAASLGRDFLTFEVKLQQESIKSEVPKVKVICTNSRNETSIVIDTFEFIKGYSIMKDEYRRIMQAIEFEEVYAIPPSSDPATNFFDNTFHLGTGFVFPEFMVRSRSLLFRVVQHRLFHSRAHSPSFALSLPPAHLRACTGLRLPDGRW